MRHCLCALLALDIACGVVFGLTRVVAYYPEVSVAVLLIGMLAGTYLFVSIALAHVIAAATSAFCSLIEGFQDKRLAASDPTATKSR